MWFSNPFNCTSFEVGPIWRLKGPPDLICLAYIRSFIYCRSFESSRFLPDYYCYETSLSICCGISSPLSCKVLSRWLPSITNSFSSSLAFNLECESSWEKRPRVSVFATSAASRSLNCSESSPSCFLLERGEDWKILWPWFEFFSMSDLLLLMFKFVNWSSSCGTCCDSYLWTLLRRAASAVILTISFLSEDLLD